MVVIVALMQCLQLEEIGFWDTGRSGAFNCPVKCQDVVGVARHGNV